MSYDSTDVLAEFHQKRQLGYPLLSDVDAAYVNALGVRNEQFGEGHRAYGVPHPGIVYVDASGKVAATFAVPGYRKRPPFDDVFTAVSAMGNAGTP